MEEMNQMYTEWQEFKKRFETYFEQHQQTTENNDYQAEDNAVAQSAVNAERDTVDESKAELYDSSVSLLPILGAMANRHLEKLEKLNTVQQRKVNKKERLFNKIDDLNAEAERLKKRNDKFEKMSTTFSLSMPNALFALTKHIVDKNNCRINDIKEKDIPKLEKEILNTERQIRKNDEKKSTATHKFNRIAALSGMIKSFVMADNDRANEIFDRSLKTYQESVYALNEIKINKANAKINKLCQDYEDAETIMEKSKISDTQDKLHERIKRLNEQSRRISEICIDSSNAAEALNQHLESGEAAKNAKECGELFEKAFTLPSPRSKILNEVLNKQSSDNKNKAWTELGDAYIEAYEERCTHNNMQDQLNATLDLTKEGKGRK